MRTTDTVFRLGGDEFAIILTHLINPQHAGTIALNILNKLRLSLSVKDQKIYITASIGIAIYPLAAQNLIDLLKSADAAMYQAKKQKGNQYQFSTKELY